MDSKPRKQRNVPNLTQKLSPEELKPQTVERKGMEMVLTMLGKNTKKIKDKLKVQTFAGKMAEEMVDDFLDEEDTISPQEMEKIKKFVVKYVLEEMYEFKTVTSGPNQRITG